VGYETQMQADILALLRLFHSRVPDPESNTQVTELAADARRWGRAHDLFDRVRERNLRAIRAGDGVRECQYSFEEVCLKSLYNETDTVAPFDACSPYWVIKNALALAQAIGVPVNDVVAIVAPTA
jgi:hypothetical protein